MKVAIVVGTRPEIIKMSPIIKACEAQHVEFSLIHTEQHYSANMSDIFFSELDLPLPNHLLKATPGSHGSQISSMLKSFEELFSSEPFDVVLVQGDTNTVLSAGLMASRRNIPVGHVEAGLRSGDRTMPEEINRVLTDHLSAYLFATSTDTLKNLAGEGIASYKAWNTGNTIVDATLRGLELAKRDKASSTNITPKNDYMLLTLHRPANVDNAAAIQDILAGVFACMEQTGLAAVFPVHPRTRGQIKDLQLHIPRAMKLVEPVGYLDFLRLQSSAKLIMTDSGGIQEEACILKTPCVTLRNNTERPETIAVGANMLGGTKKHHIVQAARQMLRKKRDWLIPYGNGHAAEQILSHLREGIQPANA